MAIDRRGLGGEIGGMERQSIYRGLARYYDLLYSFKDYEKEAEILRQLIAKHQKSKGRDLLEVACGTGGHARYLKEGFRVVATDLNAGVLAVARRRTKGVTFKQADMLTLNLGREFDVIVCLFSSIGYVKSYANLKRVLRHFARHLKPGGVVVIEPWFAPSAYETGSAHLSTYQGSGVKIARACVSRARGNVSVMDMHYLIAESGKGVKHFIDRHELGMFERGKFLRLMEEAGLKARFEKNGLMKERGLYIGMKR